jgi:hypothetical protein
LIQQLSYFNDKLTRVGELLGELLDLPAMIEENRFVVARGSATDLDDSLNAFLESAY